MYKLLFNLIDRLNVLLSYIPFPWVVKKFKVVFFLWLIRTTIVSTYSAMTDFKWKCQALCFSEAPGKCVATGADHDYTGSGNYRLSTKPNSETQQAGWRWCSKCGCLWYADWTFKGTCAAGGNHDSTGSSAYSVTRGVVPSGFQEGWRWCSKCFMLHYGANTGYCPAAGPHTAERSLNYAVEFSPAY
eukprot:m51a1_g13798 hypothetical protein (187) ;mRNA; f:353415-356511